MENCVAKKRVIMETVDCGHRIYHIRYIHIHGGCAELNGFEGLVIDKCKCV